MNEYDIRKDAVEKFIAYCLLFNASIHVIGDSEAESLLDEHRKQFYVDLVHPMSTFMEGRNIIRPLGGAQ